MNDNSGHQVTTVCGASWNVQSIRNKCDTVLEHLEDYECDFCFISESWMEADKNDITAIVKTKGFNFLHARRKNREKESGGGVGVILKNTFSYKVISDKSFKSFEHSRIKSVK